MTCDICDANTPFPWKIQPPVPTMVPGITVCDPCFQAAHGEIERLFIRVRMHQREQLRAELPGRVAR